MKSSIRDRRTLARLLRCLRACTPRRPRRVFLEEAEIELWGLYRREQAELLRQASGLRTRPSAQARWKIEPAKFALGDPERARVMAELAKLARKRRAPSAVHGPRSDGPGSGEPHWCSAELDGRSAEPAWCSAVLDGRSAVLDGRSALLDGRSAEPAWRSELLAWRSAEPAWRSALLAWRSAVLAWRSAVLDGRCALLDGRCALLDGRCALLDWRCALRDWRARAAECAALCAHDGYPLAPALAVCLAHPLHHWPSARQLRSDAQSLGARVD